MENDNMMNNVDMELMDLYILSEMAYEDTFINTVDSKEELYPEGWYGMNNYEKKIEVLGEALEKNVLIVYTDGYQTMLEGIKTL